MVRAGWLAGVLLVMVAAASAEAAPPPVLAPPPVGAGPDDAAKVEALAHYRKGVTHYDLQEYAAALEDFRSAYRVVQNPAFLFNIAQCYRKLGRKTEALEYYRSYLRRLPAQAPDRAQVERRVQELEREFGIGPGAAPGPAPPPVAALADPPATPPTSPADPSTGGEEAPGRRLSGRRIGALVAGGLGVVGIGVGSAVALSARASYRDAAGRCPDRVCSDPRDKQQGDDARARGDLATGIWIAGAAALATGAILWFIAPAERRASAAAEPRASAAVAATPLVGPSFGGLAIEGTF